MARFDEKKLQSDNLVDKLVSINRVSKTVKGGRNMSFSALVVVGDKAGMVGFGKGKALEVQAAVQKATKAAKAKMIRVPLKEGRTLHHDSSAKYGASKLVVRSAVPGTDGVCFLQIQGDDRSVFKYEISRKAVFYRG